MHDDAPCIHSKPFSLSFISQKLLIEEVGKILGAGLRSTFTAVKQRSGLLPNGRTLLGTVLDPLGIFRFSKLVESDDLDRRTLEAAGRLARLVRSAGNNNGGKYEYDHQAGAPVHATRSGVPGLSSRALPTEVVSAPSASALANSNSNGNGDGGDGGGRRGPLRNIVARINLANWLETVELNPADARKLATAVARKLFDERRGLTLLGGHLAYVMLRQTASRLDRPRTGEAVEGRAGDRRADRRASGRERRTIGEQLRRPADVAAAGYGPVPLPSEGRGGGGESDRLASARVLLRQMESPDSAVGR